MNERNRTELLLVDDDPDTLQAMAFALDGMWKDMRIETAQNGEEACRKLAHMRPDLIITDLNMPDVDGLRLCRAVREDRNLNHAKVLVVTGRSDRHANARAFEEGADEYMVKPVAPSELRRAAIRLLGLGLLPDGRIQ